MISWCRKFVILGDIKRNSHIRRSSCQSLKNTELLKVILFLEKRQKASLLKLYSSTSFYWQYVAFLMATESLDTCQMKELHLNIFWCTWPLRLHVNVDLIGDSKTNMLFACLIRIHMRVFQTRNSLNRISHIRNKDSFFPFALYDSLLVAVEKITAERRRMCVQLQNKPVERKVARTHFMTLWDGIQ